MKKLLIAVMALLIGSAAQAQEKVAKKEAKHFFALEAGPSFPTGDFNSTKLINSSTGLFENREAGFARTGVNVNLNYGYQFNKYFTLAANVFYNHNAIKSNAFTNQLNLLFESEVGAIPANSLKLDHWKWYGITAGPMLTENLNSNISLNFKVLGGIANANSPKVVFEGTKIVGEDWSVAPVVQAGVDLRFNVAKNVFIVTGAGYQYLRPKFTIEYDLDGTVTEEKTKQKFSAANVTAGLGIRF